MKLEKISYAKLDAPQKEIQLSGDFGVLGDHGSIGTPLGGWMRREPAAVWAGMSTSAP